MDQKTRFGVYFAWDYDREEARINSMAKDGWQLKKGGSLHHTYERSDKNYRYKIDYNTNAKFNNEEYRRYLSFFEEQGWELINSTFNGWYYFRKPYVEGSDKDEYELYTDNDSLKDMLSKWNAIARGLQVCFLVLFILNLVHFIFNKWYFSSFSALGALFGFLFFQAGIASMKRKRIQTQSKSKRRINISYLLLLGMIISYILMFNTTDEYNYDYKLKYSQSINKDTEKRVETMAVEKDGSYTLDIKSKGDRGIVGIQILKDTTVVYSTSGANYNIITDIELEKGEYQIEVRYYLENLEGVQPMPITQEALEKLNLTGDLEEYSEVSVFVGIR